MNAVMDLAARAVSFIVLIQDTLLHLQVKGAQEGEAFSASTHPYENFKHQGERIRALTSFREKALETVWLSLEKPDEITNVTKYAYERCAGLIDWLKKEKNAEIIDKRLGNYKYFPAPDDWRDTIREILYKDTQERIELINTLHYIPLYIILAAGGNKFEAKEQRLLQIGTIPGQTSAGISSDEPIAPTALSEKYLPQILSGSDQKAYYDYLKRFLKKITEARKKELKQETTNGSQSEIILAAKLIESLILNDEKLIEQLNKEKVPLPFEYILNEEVGEIIEARKLRIAEIKIAREEQDIDSTSGFDEIFEKGIKSIDGTEKENEEEANALADTTENDKGAGNGGGNEKRGKTYSPPLPDKISIADPLVKAEEMGLWGLALSGGGIRSAAFNLGILQGLAKHGLLTKFDYISTVSGGGYIGSWFISWIKRHGSLLKIIDRLNPVKSANPNAEAVRPIRWLRMYSNYLTPNTGIMSTDSWTAGMILVRNMLLNQLIIVGLILTILAGAKLLFSLWSSFFLWKENILLSFSFDTWSGIFLLLGAILAGLGMHSYHTELPRISIANGVKKHITVILLSLGCFVSLLLSAWIVTHVEQNKNFAGILERLLWTMVFGAIALLLVSAMGRYDKCVPGKGLKKIGGIFLIIVFSILAALFGGCLLTWVFLGIKKIRDCGIADITSIELGKLIFTISPPIIIEVISFTVIMRMALLGHYFPDERREWWGRMGGMVHRVAACWLIIVGFSFLGRYLLDSKGKEMYEFFTAGWGVTVLAGVRAAFAGNTSGDKESKGAIASSMEMLALVAPYLFGLGLLVFLPGIVDSIIHWAGGHVFVKGAPEQWVLFAVLCALAAITVLLSWRIGVNQFSMHLFYKNRLVRAFLGATRTRLERIKSANPFTGFDHKDDLTLSLFNHKENYFGPYPLINTALNATHTSNLERQDRKSESFVFTPLFCGFDFARTRANNNSSTKSYDFAYRPTKDYAYPNGGPHVGTAMAISGAAANPNQGYHTSAPTAFLLSLFNVRLGWWIGNPRKGNWKNGDPNFGLGYIVSDLIGRSDTSNEFVCLSDGAHFDNMGLYELVRRRCRNIILGDGEQDGEFRLEGLANAIRKCRIDFGVEITFDNINDITGLSEQRHSKRQYAFGTIHYPGNPGFTGRILYVKSSVTEKETIDIREYALKNKAFPHQSTGDQFFDEAQFESYRKLGFSIVDKLFPPKPQPLS